MKKSDNPNSIFYDGPLVPEVDPEQVRLAALRAAREANASALQGRDGAKAVGRSGFLMVVAAAELAAAGSLATVAHIVEADVARESAGGLGGAESASNARLKRAGSKAPKAAGQSGFAIVLKAAELAAAGSLTAMARIVKARVASGSAGGMGGAESAPAPRTKSTASKRPPEPAALTSNPAAARQSTARSDTAPAASRRAAGTGSGRKTREAARASAGDGIRPASPVMPAKVAETTNWLGLFPLLSTEDREAFDHLIGQLSRVLSPKDAVEEFAVHEMAYQLWKVARLRAWQTGLIDGAYTDAISNALTDVVGKSRAHSLTWGWSKRISEIVDKVRYRLEQIGLTEAVVLARAASEQLDLTERLEAAEERTLERYKRGYRDLDDHRARVTLENQAGLPKLLGPEPAGPAKSSSLEPNAGAGALADPSNASARVGAGKGVDPETVAPGGRTSKPPKPEPRS